MAQEVEATDRKVGGLISDHGSIDIYQEKYNETSRIDLKIS